MKRALSSGKTVCVASLQWATKILLSKWLPGQVIRNRPLRSTVAPFPPCSGPRLSADAGLPSEIESLGTTVAGLQKKPLKGGERYPRPQDHDLGSNAPARYADSAHCCA